MSDFNFYNSYYQPNPGIKKIVPDPVYNPNNAPFISSGTKLARGVSIGKFLGAVGEKTNLNHITNDADRLQIARQLYLHAMAMNTMDSETQYLQSLAQGNPTGGIGNAQLQQAAVTGVNNINQDNNIGGASAQQQIDQMIAGNSGQYLGSIQGVGGGVGGGN